jgi:hypothetical protein
MLKRARTAGLVPALVVSIVIAISLIAPASARFNLAAPSCGYGYGYPPAVPTVVNVSPNVGPTTGGTAVTITGTGFCGTITAVNFGANAATGVTTISDTQATAVSPAGAAGTVDVTVTTTKGTSATSPLDQFTYVATTTVLTSCSRSQYKLTGSDGSTWLTIDATKLTITVTPSAASSWLITGNADLWTQNLGFNQDLGIAVSGGAASAFPTTAGQPEAWKESGGRGGTFSPNAAAVQTVINVAAGQTYVATLQLKTNQPDSGTIWVGAGPTGGQFSQTCINSQLVPVATPTTITSMVSTGQYNLPGSDGTTWKDMDATNLSASVLAPADGFLLITANSDLWTSVAGVNQDIAITVGGAVKAWKESGGSAGTFSPNAAFVQVVMPVASGSTSVVKIQWKAQQPTAGTIYAGAGPIGTKFSPTRLTALFLSTAQKPIDKVSTLQYGNQGSDGSFWDSMDSSRLSLPFAPTANCTVVVSANVDLWTANGGINQDVGILVVNGAYPTVAGQPEGWKESGGGSGTFSPNAAYLQIVVSLTAGKAYSFELVWKANQPNTGTIFAGAGPIGGAFSPTRLTLQPIGC